MTRCVRNEGEIKEKSVSDELEFGYISFRSFSWKENHQRQSEQQEAEE